MVSCYLIILSLCSAAVIIENSLNSEQDRNETFKLDERERWSSTDLIVPVGDLENLRQESLQLRTLLVGEIEALESVVVAKNQEAKSAQATASDYALRFGIELDNFISNF